MQDRAHRPLAFIGGGNMGRAIIAGLIRSGYAPSAITVADAYPPTREALVRDFGITVTDDNSAAAGAADLIVLAVKPQQLAEVVRAMQPSIAARRPVVLSVAAGIRAADLSRWVGPGIAVVRSMPNRPALLGAGATALYADAGVSAADREFAQRVLEVTGLTVWVEREGDLDWVTALSGSGPAYFFLLAELLAKSAAARGIAPETAARLAAHTLYGAGQMAGMPDADLKRLREEVTSRGGTTAAALASFEANGLAALVDAAVNAAGERSRELGDQFGRE